MVTATAAVMVIYDRGNGCGYILRLYLAVAVTVAGVVARDMVAVAFTVTIAVMLSNTARFCL